MLLVNCKFVVSDMVCEQRFVTVKGRWISCAGPTRLICMDVLTSQCDHTWVFFMI